MGDAERPESVEHRWDILYRDYPDVYDEFASYPYAPDPLDVLADRLDLAGKTLVDVGAARAFRPSVLLGEREWLSALNARGRCLSSPVAAPHDAR